MTMQQFSKTARLSGDLSKLLTNARSVTLATRIEELEDLACGGKENSSWTVSYRRPDGREIDELKVVRVKNGISANYIDPYMRRRDPDCMLIADENATDKARYKDRFNTSFDELRQETLEWLAGTDLAVFAFEMGQNGLGGDALAVCPANAGFFAFGLGLLQGVVDVENLDRPFKPATIIYVAPPFRHTHFEGKQIVVHNRGENHEIFSYNLYPGPSAKKGVYGALIELGEQSGWVTAHCSAVEVVTPYDNLVGFMHEGASGGGKSEMLQQPHREPDGRLLLGHNVVTKENRYLEIPRTCDLHPVCDDMGLCHPDLQDGKGKLSLVDAENAWFVRVDHIRTYGTDPELEGLTLDPSHPQLFLNIDAVAGSTALIWDHIEDEPGRPCPNPRVIIPRAMVPNATQDKTVIDIRSFGVRTPPCTAEAPSYGILGLLHVLPPALAWLWRLVAPRGYANPSIVDKAGMSSEGVGSYWPFSTGKRVAQANLLLQQFQEANLTRYVLSPNQHVGAWRTGFMPQWLVRDYLARRGHARFRPGQIIPSRCSLLGYSMTTMRIEGSTIPTWFLQVDKQPEVGPDAFDEGSRMLTEFFHHQLKKYLEPGLDETGRKIIECCLSGGTVEDYLSFMESEEL
jgi:hypothetical protein